MPHGGLYEFTKSGATFAPPVGRRDTLVQNGDGSFTMTLQDSRTVLQFRSDGGLASMTDEYGNAINYQYDANGRVQRIADGSGSGRYADVTWNPATGRIAAVTDSAGRTVRYAYDAAGRLDGVASAVTPQGELSSRYAYIDGRFGPLLSTVRDRWYRLVTSVEWDSFSRVKSYTEGTFTGTGSTGEKYTYEYFPNGDLISPDPYTTKTSSLGMKKYKYVPGTGIVTNDGTDYSAGGQVTATYDDNENMTAYVYDVQGRLLQEKIYDGYGVLQLQWNYTYEVAYPWKVATRKSNRPQDWSGTRYEYWAAGSSAPGALKTVYQYRTDGTTEDWVESYHYDSRGRMTLSQSGDGRPQIRYVYNAAGDLIQTGMVGAPNRTFGHDALGRVTTATDEMGKTTTYTYDAADRILTATLPKPSPAFPLQFVTTFLYDQHDPPSGLTFVHAIDANGRITKSGYDELGRLAKSVSALGAETTYAYRYNLLDSITDANGNVTSYTYDADRRLATTVSPDGAVEWYTYGSRSGRLATRTDRRGNLAQYIYDRYGRVVVVKFPGNSWPNGIVREVHTSDMKGRNWHRLATT
jgi:YD repeat-containing protein